MRRQPHGGSAAGQIPRRLPLATSRVTRDHPRGGEDARPLEAKSVNWMWDAAHPAAPVACTAMTPAPHYGFPVGSFRRECNVGGE